MKKTKPLILKIICIFSFLLFIPKAVLGVSNESNDSFQRLFLEKTLEERLNPIAKNFDANAMEYRDFRAVYFVPANKLSKKKELSPVGK